MSFSVLFFLLSLAFVVHNYEEWRGYENLMRAFHGRLPKKLRDQWIFGFALIVLSIVVLLLSVVGWLWRIPTVTVLARIIVFALLINALSHCILSLYRRELIAGTVSAVFLIIPVSAAAILSMSRESGDPAWVLFGYILLSIAITPIAIYASLGLGYLAKRRLKARKLPPGI